MMKITLVCVGKLKEKYWRDACAEYEKRLARFCKLEIRELPERTSLKDEGTDILKNLRGYVLVLAIEGKEMTSEQFAFSIKKLQDAGREATFVIGSSCGLCDEVKGAADEKISFSKMTFPHQMFRVVLLEQLYRAFMIGAGAEYHK